MAFTLYTLPIQVAEEQVWLLLPCPNNTYFKSIKKYKTEITSVDILKVLLLNKLELLLENSIINILAFLLTVIIN
jgi:hypothetical protein